MASKSAFEGFLVFLWLCTNLGVSKSGGAFSIISDAMTLLVSERLVDVFSFSSGVVANFSDEISMWHVSVRLWIKSFSSCSILLAISWLSYCVCCIIMLQQWWYERGLMYFSDLLRMYKVEFWWLLICRLCLVVSPKDMVLIALVATVGDGHVIPICGCNVEKAAYSESALCRSDFFDWITVVSWWSFCSSYHYSMRSLFLFMPTSSDGDEEDDPFGWIGSLSKVLITVGLMVVAVAKLVIHGFEKICSFQNITFESDVVVVWKAITSLGSKPIFEDFRKLLLRNLFGILSLSNALSSFYVIGFSGSEFSLVMILFGRMLSQLVCFRYLIVLYHPSGLENLSFF